MSQLRRRPKDAPPRRQREPGEFDSVVIERPRAVMATGMDKVRPAPVPALLQKTPDRKRQSLRDSARGEQCQMRLVGCCLHTTDTTVLAHWPGIDGGRGMGLKSLDICSVYACAACHDALDGRRPLPVGASRQSVLIDFLAGHMRTLERFTQKGLL